MRGIATPWGVLSMGVLAGCRMVMVIILRVSGEGNKLAYPMQRCATVGGTLGAQIS